MNTFKRNWPLHAMVLPAFILLVTFHYLPMFGIVIAFQDYKPWIGIMNSVWVGLDHFRMLFEFEDSQRVIWNTLVIAVIKIFTGLIVPFSFALLLNEVKETLIKRSVQTLVYLPHFLSWVVLGGILVDILSPEYGLVNHFLKALGIEPIFFLGSNDWFRFTIILSDVWKEFGFSTIIFLAALSGINPEMYEASVIDGANRWKQVYYITIPAMLPIAVVVTTLSLGSILNAGFDQIFNLYNPLVYETGDIIDTYVYRVGLIDRNYSFATAVGLFKSVVSFVLIVTSYRLAYKLANYRIF
ncbi:ABC transporter permease subunit [Paenibacillus sp. LHD-38]|uniref:ABC transporter permease n=1 Tax=Paenibacillus sp. LHD-38 TaxID=3072143 RepID=UPI00280EC31D|nr:ABC transporter permease subunit [Paenibacillus sp. LHD-38]MDQ8739243.1 ABC transporter permease subunit [Paenibacillus sp. LHD-38]